MLFEGLFFIVRTFIVSVLDLIPDLPATPQAVIDAGNYMVTLVGSLGGILGMIFGTQLLVGMFIIIVALIAFEPAWHLTIWLLRKIPISIH